MLITKAGETVADPWVLLEGEAAGGGDAPLMVTLEHWRSHREALMGHNGPLGLMLADDESPALVAEELERFALIALDFPAFKNGRAYSSARLLRQRYGFTGEIRAVGDVLRDQIAFMIRCGFDSFAVADDFPLEAWAEITGEMTHVYQSAADDRINIIDRRHGEQ